MCEYCPAEYKHHQHEHLVIPADSSVAICDGPTDEQLLVFIKSKGWPEDDAAKKLLAEFRSEVVGDYNEEHGI